MLVKKIGTLLSKLIQLPKKFSKNSNENFLGSCVSKIAFRNLKLKIKFIGKNLKLVARNII